MIGAADDSPPESGQQVLPSMFETEPKVHVGCQGPKSLTIDQAL